MKAINVSVVIPTYNRGPKLAVMLDHLLASEVYGLSEVDIVVVDDGSAQPAAGIVDSLDVRPGVSLRCVRQENAGPAAARNRGFRESRGEIVLFVDDDVLCPPDLMRRHVEAHRRFPGSAIVGRCPFAEQHHGTPLFRFVDSLGHDGGRGASEEFLNISILASGQISFERSMFDRVKGVYRDDLATPAAEEYELSLRLRDRGVPILLATRITAGHDHPVTLRGMCGQAYKHGMGCAEAAVKCPRTMELHELDTIIKHNGPVTPEDSLSGVTRKLAKRLLSAGPVRHGLLAAVRGCETILPWDRLLGPLYRMLLGTFFFAGVRAGFRQFPSGRRVEVGETAATSPTRKALVNR